jgi:hypothetical protein
LPFIAAVDAGALLFCAELLLETASSFEDAFSCGLDCIYTSLLVLSCEDALFCDEFSEMSVNVGEILGFNITEEKNE